MTEKVKRVCTALRQSDRHKVIALLDNQELNHVERKILTWGFLDRLSIRQISDKLCLSETRIKHLKRGAIDKLSIHLEWETSNAKN